MIEKELEGINNNLFKENFNWAHVALTEKLFKIKDANKKSTFVKEIQNRWSDLNDKLKKCLKKKEVV